MTRAWLLEAWRPWIAIPGGNDQALAPQPEAQAQPPHPQQLPVSRPSKLLTSSAQRHTHQFQCQQLDNIGDVVQSQPSITLHTSRCAHPSALSVAANCTDHCGAPT